MICQQNKEAMIMGKEIKIKTRNTKKDIKVFDRAADVSTHMKNTLVKSSDSRWGYPGPRAGASALRYRLV
jgi:hypothetical protein